MWIENSFCNFEAAMIIAEILWKVVLGEEFGGGAELKARVVTVAGLFVAFSLCLSFYLLFQHLSTYNVPSEQRWLIGVIFMVPVYAISSFVSLWNPEISIESNLLGNSYEAFAMYSFSRYLFACLGGEEMAIQKLEKMESSADPLLENQSESHAVHHPVPMNWCLESWELGRQFTDGVKFGIVQYMILKTTCSWLALVLERFELYGDAEFDWSKGYPYITFVLNFSQLWALYCLILFYRKTKEELHFINPLAKFLCFKAVVFVTWWQGVTIAFLFSSGLALRWFSEQAIFRGHIQSGLQDLSICIEMAVAAVAHIFVYPATPYDRGFNYEGTTNILGIIAETMMEQDLEAAATSIKESFQDVVLRGGGHVVQDVKATVSQAVEPLESGIMKFNETFHETIQFWSGKQQETITKEDVTVVTGPDDSTKIQREQETVQVLSNPGVDRNSETCISKTTEISCSCGTEATSHIHSHSVSSF